MDTVETASRKVKQMGRQIESSVGNLKNMMSSISLVGDAKHFQEGKGKFDALRAKLENKQEKSKLDAMKTLIAMMTLGRDVSELFPSVVKNVVVESMEIKKLVYMYVIHYASMNPNLALLSISSFQKDMASPNPLVRAKALHAMSCMRVASVAHLIILQLKNAVKDSSPYVRRTASQVLPSVHELDGKFKADLIVMLTTLLSDDDVYVLSGALYAFNSLCPNKFDIIHANYRKICHLLADMDENGQIIALNVLLRYCRNQFKSPFIKEKTENDATDTKNDEDEDDDDDDDLLRLTSTDDLDDFVELDPDHKLLIASVKNLIYSMNSAVVLSVVTLLFYCAPKNECIEPVRALISFINFSKREISYCILANISTMASQRPALFCGFYKDFYIKSIEAGFLKELKLDILSKITTDSNINHILVEFEAYAADPDISFRCSTIDAMGRCSSMIPDVAEKTMHSLMSLLSPSAQSPDVVAASVVVIRQIIQRSPAKYERSMLKLLSLLQKTNVPAARSAIVWILGEYRQYISDYVPDALRILAKKFIHEANEVKLQILNLAVKVYLADPKKVILLFKYILDLCKYDQNYDLRDRARLIRCIFFQKKKKKSSSSAIDAETQRKLRTKMQEMFLAEKKMPEIVSTFQDRDRFVMNTLSHMIMRNAGECYQSLEDFPEIAPNNADKRTPADSTSGALWNTNKEETTKRSRTKQGEGFFDDDSSIEEFTTSEEDDDSESGSGSSDTESGSRSSGSSDSESDSTSSSSATSDTEESGSSSDTEESDESESDESHSIAVKKAAKTKKKDIVAKKESSPEEEEDESVSEEEESSSDLEVAEIFVAPGNTPSVKKKEKEEADKDKKEDKRKKEQDEDGTDADDESEESEEEILSITSRKSKKKKKDKKEKESKTKESASSKPQAGDLLGGLFGTIEAVSTPIERRTERVATAAIVSGTNDTFDVFDLLASGDKTTVESIHKVADTQEEEKESSDDEDEIKSKSKSKKKSKKKAKKDSKKSKKQKKEKATEASSEESELGSDDFASDSNEEILNITKEANEEIKMDLLASNVTQTKTTKKKERADQLSDLFSSVMGDTVSNPMNDDILFGAAPETLMKGAVSAITGFKGELLNHTHTQGLQIEYEFVRQNSRYGVRFNQIKLIFMNRWDKSMRGISLRPHNLDKSQQDYRDIFDGGIAELLPGQKKTDYIHVQFGKTSEMRFNINVEEGTNKIRHTAKIKGIPGELMRPNVSYSIDEFLQKKSQSGAMNERKLNVVIENIEEAANDILKAFNVGIVNSGANKNKFDSNKQRYFAAYLLADDSDVLIALETQANNKIVCFIHCTEFMLIDAITGVARQCLTTK